MNCPNCPSSLLQPEGLTAYCPECGWGVDKLPDPIPLNAAHAAELYHDRPLTIMTEPPPFVVSFHNDGKEVGRLAIDDDTGKLEFTGDVEASAFEFFNHLTQLFNGWKHANDQGKADEKKG